MDETVYVIAQVQVDDREAYQEEYLPTTIDRIEAHGGSLLVGADEAEVLEGEWDGNWTVVIEFPSATDATDFFEDEEYGEVVGVRHEAAAFSNIALVPSFDDSSS
ncbi:DUF1330 domain-containing protein [Halobaculum limi]|uniref:DUF1330 domain-containing protein n=1 Tax=Halobaculum limi TaxID=3031916 RepID=UPI002405E4E6|nr:DUF1330 domain-containing protein [Halobaculum sp. YSMS11]